MVKMESETLLNTITVENTGNTDLTGLSFVDTFKDLNGDLIVLSSGPIYDDSSISSLSSTLEVGEIKAYLATFIINQQAVNAGGVLTQFVYDSPGKSNNVFDVSDDRLQAMAMAMVIQPMT